MSDLTRFFGEFYSLETASKLVFRLHASGGNHIPPRFAVVEGILVKIPFEDDTELWQFMVKTQPSLLEVAERIFQGFDIDPMDMQYRYRIIDDKLVHVFYRDDVELRQFCNKNIVFERWGGELKFGLKLYEHIKKN